MRNIQILLLAIIAAFISTACTVEHTVNFNKDMSGTNSISVDMGEMMSMLKAFQPEVENDSSNSLFGDYNMENELAEIEKDFDKTEGLSNFKSVDKVKEGFFGFSFDFADVKYISEGMKDAKKREKYKADNIDEGLFVLGKNSLKLNFSSSDFKDAFNNDDKEKSKEDNILAGFSLGDYALKLNFPFPIKKVDNDLYLISEDRKSLSLMIAIEEITENTQSMDAEIFW